MIHFGPEHLQTFRRSVLPSYILYESLMRCSLVDWNKHFGDICCLYLQSKRRRHQFFFFSRRCYLYVRRHDVISQKSVILIFTATITWNPNFHLALHVADLGEKDDFLYRTVTSNPRAQRLLEIRVGIVRCPERGRIKDYHRCFSEWDSRWGENTCMLKMVSWITHLSSVLPWQYCTGVIFNSTYVGWFRTKG